MAQTASAGTLKRTPFHDIHVALGGKMVPFAGYEMPVQYPTGITAEHRAVRSSCGVFDVSHMGELVVRGPGAADFLNFVTTNDVSKLAVGQAHYTTILSERGTIEEDGLVYRVADRLMFVVNASNREKVVAHLSRYLDRFDCSLEDISDDIALLALQGPDAERILQPLTEVELPSIKYYWFAVGTVAGAPDVIISRTGYTGEDGFELYFSPDHADGVWRALVDGGRVTPAGLGARDSLRLEMGMALYGNDIDDTVTPLEANLAWLVKMKKGEFVGRDALQRQKEAGIGQRLVGFTTPERSFPRHGYPVYYQGVPTGIVRSGTMSPSLEIPIGTCYLPIEGSAEGTAFEIEIRGKRIGARVSKMPFYTRGSAKKPGA